MKRLFLLPWKFVSKNMLIVFALDANRNALSVDVSLETSTLHSLCSESMQIDTLRLGNIFYILNKFSILDGLFSK